MAQTDAPDHWKSVWTICSMSGETSKPEYGDNWTSNIRMTWQTKAVFQLRLLDRKPTVTNTEDGGGQRVFLCSVPSTGWNINLWLVDLVNASLFQTSATVRQPDSITYGRIQTHKHTQSWMTFLSFHKSSMGHVLDFWSPNCGPS